MCLTACSSKSRVGPPEFPESLKFEEPGNKRDEEKMAALTEDETEMRSDKRPRDGVGLRAASKSDNKQASIEKFRRMREKRPALEHEAVVRRCTVGSQLVLQ